MVTDEGLNKMKISIETISERKLFFVTIMAMLLIFSTFLTFSFEDEPVLDNLIVEIHSKTTPISLGERTTLQVFVFDKNYSSIDPVQVQLFLQDVNQVTQPIKQKFIYVENGLYETEIQFLLGGYWDGKVEVQKGRSIHKQDYRIFVQS